MPATNYTPIQLYRSTTSGNLPLAANLSPGELALNIADNDMTMYMENASGVVKSFFNNPAALKYPTADGTSGQVLQTNGAGVLSFGAAGGGANIQSFPATGTYTKPPGAKFVMVEIWGAGGGGAEGGTVKFLPPGAGQSAAGGGGGGGGAYTYRMFAAPQIGSTETVTIGAGGAGGSVPTGSAGASGGTTNFGTLLYSYGGKGSSPGCLGAAGGSIINANIRGFTGSCIFTNITGGSDLANTNFTLSIWGGGLGAPQSTPQKSGRGSIFGGGGGGMGGPASTGCGNVTAKNSGTSGGTRIMGSGSPFASEPPSPPAPSPFVIGSGNGGGGGAAGAPSPVFTPSPGTPGTAGGDYQGGGGGGAGYQKDPPYPTTIGGTGGAGGLGGGGGGGGAAAINQPTTSPLSSRTSGGAGGNGYIIVYTW